jgi:hypothetical protein
MRTEHRLTNLVLAVLADTAADLAGLRDEVAEQAGMGGAQSATRGDRGNHRGPLRPGPFARAGESGGAKARTRLVPILMCDPSE